MLKNRFLNLLPQLVAFAFITIAGLFLFVFFGAKVYFPVSVSIEMKSPEDNVCQLFYSTFDRYYQNHNLSETYPGSEDFTTIQFLPGASNVRYLRIDPGNRSGKYEIKQIAIRVGDQEKVFLGEEIPKHFELVNILERGYSFKDSALLIMAESDDVQFVFKHRLHEVFQMVSQMRISLWQVGIGIIYLLSVWLIFLKGRQFFEFAKNAIKTQLKLTSQPITLKPSSFSIAVIGLFLVKLILVSAQPMTALTGMVHDDALFVRLAYSFGSGKWLGYYDSFTLIKGPVFPIFIALTNFAGIPLFLAQNLLFGFACLLLVKALAPLIQKSGWKIVLFAILLFNPAGSDVFATRVLRDALFVSLSLMVVAAFVGIYLRRRADFRTILTWSFFAGVVLFLHQNTREEGFVFIPFLVFLTMLSWMVSARSIFARRFQFRKTARISALFLLPFILLIAGNMMLASLNYMAYGRFLRNEIKSEAFSEAFAALSKIESETWFINVPVTHEARKKAYRVSPAFAELEKYMEGEGNGFLEYSGIPQEIIGAHFIWALRYAADAAGYHSSLPKSQDFYKRLAHQINEGFESGKLEKKENFSFASYSWDDRYTLPFMKKIPETAYFAIAFKGYSSRGWPSLGSKADIAYFQNMTNQTASIAVVDAINQPLASKLKLRTLDLIAKFYGLINPAISLIAAFSFFLLTVLVILRKGRNSIKDYWILASVFLALAAVRIALIAFLAVSQWDAVNMHYLSVGYPFLILFNVVAVVALIEYFFSVNLQGRYHELK